MVKTKWRFSLRSAFVFVTLSAVVYGFANRIVERRSYVRPAVEHLEELGGKVEYHRDLIPGLSRLIGADVRSIDLSGTSFSDDEAVPFRYMRRLERLDLSGTNVSDDGLALLARNHKLRTLLLCDCPGITNDSFSELRKLKRLEVLDLHNSRCFGSHGENIEQLSRLKKFVFSGSLSSDGIVALSGIEAIPVGAVKLWGISIDDLRAFLELDMTRVTALSIHNREDRGNCITTNELESLETLGSHGFDNVDIHFGGELDDVVKSVGVRCHTLRVSASWLLFELSPDANGQGLRVFYDFQGSSRGTNWNDWGARLNIELIKSLPNLEVLETCDRYCVNTIAALLPDLPLSVHPKIQDYGHPSKKWELLKQATNLKAITLNGALDGMSFTGDHQLERLELVVVHRFDEQLFHEIGKLKKLRYLRIEFDEAVADELMPLESLENLTELMIGPLKIEARDALRGMGFELKHFWDETRNGKVMWKAERSRGEVEAVAGG